MVQIILNSEGILILLPGFSVNPLGFCLLLRVCFHGLASAMQYLVQGALQQWLGNIINVESVKATNEQSVNPTRSCIVCHKAHATAGTGSIPGGDLRLRY
jgi:hypothetical protein